MIIKQTVMAISFYELAIKNARAQLEFQVNQDVKYQEFQEKYRDIATTSFFSHQHSMNFEFYRFVGTQMTTYFHIRNGEIFYLENSIEFENIEEIAQELLGIVSKFYE